MAVLLLASTGELDAQEIPNLPEEAAPAEAEDATPPADTPRALRLPVLVIDQSALFSESAAARSIAAQAAEAEQALDAELDVIGESLRTRERELSDLRTTLPKAEFDSLAAEFERDVRAFYALSQRERSRVDQGVRNARDQLRRSVEGVLIQIMRKYNALVMLDEEQVVLSVNALDITAEAIAGLDETVAEIELQLPPSEDPDEP